jgi:predicted nucleotidyltransferase
MLETLIPLSSSQTSRQVKHFALGTTILRGLVGSTIHGLNVNDGLEDRDEMGVCVEPIEHVAGLHQFEQYIYRSAQEREQNHNARSKAGDLDLTIYSLRKYARLALKGNPTIITLLFVPEHDCVVITDIGRELQSLASSIISKRAGGAFLGYMQAQKQRLLGERGGRHGTRPELLGEHGYDTKYAMHILRLGYQGVELMQTGRLSLPVEKDARNFMLNVRNGSVELQTVMSKAGELERELKDLLDTSPLPEHPESSKIENWVVEQYQRAFCN